MKIAIVSSGYLPVVDGVTVALEQRLRSLSRRGHEVLLFCPDYRAIAPIYPNWSQYTGDILPGVRVVNLPSEPFMGVEFERNISRQAQRQLQEELLAFEPDLIHVDEPDRLFLGLFNAPGVAIAKGKSLPGVPKTAARHRIPCVGFYHTNFVDYIEDFFPLPRPVVALLQWGSTQIIRRVFNAYDATFVASPETQRRVKRLGIRNSVCDRFLGVDVQAFQAQSRDPQFFQNQYGLKGLEDKLKLVFLGRLTPDKGWQFTLRAFEAWVKHPEAAPWIERVALIIAGDGELRDDIANGLRRLGLTVHLLGRISPDAVPPLLVNSDLHITTSEKETLGLTVLEAFAAGIPAIAPRAGGVVATIRHGENGLLFTPQDSDDFGRSLLRLLTDSDLRQRLGQQGQKDVAAYDWEVAVTTLLQAWQGQIERVGGK